MRVRAFRLLAIAVVLLGADRALAGMPSLLTEDFQTIFRLNETPHERFQAISFFLLGVFVSTWVVRTLWNYLARDFTRLPRLTYFKALAMVVLWGFLFIVVLTMISGARELMTPGAWKKNGITYSVVDDPAARQDGEPNWKLKPFERVESGAQKAGQRP
jgi:hypothetical protein